MSQATTMTWKEKYIGPKDFYSRTAKIAVPLALQSLLNQAMSIADTLMVSWIGEVTSVGTAAQIDVLAGMISYGIIGGIGIFSAQFFGANDQKGLKKALGLSLVLACANALFWFCISTFCGRQVLSFYMQDPLVLDKAMEYLNIYKYGFVISTVAFCLSYMYRSTHQAALALKVSIFGMVMNIVLNYVFIFGFGPIPAMGVKGAALGTVIADSAMAVFLFAHAFFTKQPFIGSFSEMFTLPKTFVQPILKKIAPLILNETFFGFGQTLFVKAFGQLGKEQMDAYYVGNQIYNLTTFAIYGYGNAVQVLLGTTLGQGRIEQAKKECNYHLGLSMGLAVVLVLVLICFARPMVSFFAITNPIVNDLAVWIVYVLAIKVSMRLFNFVLFSILKSGGDSKIIQFLDAGLEWGVGLTMAFAAVNLFGIRNMALVLLITQLEQLVRLGFAWHRMRQNYWAKDVTKLVTE